MDLQIVHRTSSTNADLLQALQSGPLPEGHTLLAWEQTAGQGRAGRGWDTSAIQALTFSTVVTPRWSPEMWGWIPLLAGAAVAQTLSIDVPGIGLKWPNDIMVPAPDGSDVEGWGTWRKAGGVLTQVAPHGEQVVVGVGLNLAQIAPIGDGEPHLPAPHAGFLFSPGQVGEVGSPDAQEVAVEITKTVVEQLAELLAASEPDRTLVEDLCITLGQWVRIDHAGNQSHTEGRASQLAPDGALGIETEKETVWISSGDVQHLRAK